MAFLPPIHRYLPLILEQSFSPQRLERIPEPQAVTDQQDHVLQYDRVMTTKLAIAYAIALESIYRTRREPFGGAAIDLACGPGHLSLCLARYLRLDYLVGVDLSLPMVQVATRNAQLQDSGNTVFRQGDITALQEIADTSYDLSSFCNAAHHMEDLATVARVLAEMDRITKPEGLVFVMDLARLKTKKLTDKYVELLGRDYKVRGLASFYTDFYNSMYAAWTSDELLKMSPENPQRKWFGCIPVGLPTLQILIGVPRNRARRQLRRGVPWSANASPLRKELRGEWRLLRRSLAWFELH